MEILAAAITFLVVMSVIKIIGGLIDLWGQVELPEEYNVKLSDTDQEKISASKSVIQECFGDNVIEYFRSANNFQRITMTEEFARRLAKLYDLDVDIDIVVDEVQKFGVYDWNNKKLKFNIILLTVEADNANFDYCVRETIDTIIHELRHAVQDKAVNNPGFWNVDDETRKLWADNMMPGNYIRPEVDIRAYSEQPIEKDAFTFSSMIMKGVC